MEGVNYPTLSHPEERRLQVINDLSALGAFVELSLLCQCDLGDREVTGMWLEAALSGWILVL